MYYEEKKWASLSQNNSSWNLNRSEGQNVEIIMKKREDIPQQKYKISIPNLTDSKHKTW